MKARVTVTLKAGVLDPQGQAIEGSLKSLGFDGVASVRQGKVFDLAFRSRRMDERSGCLFSNVRSCRLALLSEVKVEDLALLQHPPAAHESV